MSHRLSKNDPLYYKTALRGLIDEAKENGVTVSINENRVVFDDRREESATTVCSCELDFFKQIIN